MTGRRVIAYGLLAFSLGVRYLKVIDHGSESEEQAELPILAKGSVRV